jgi:hypothetical protein
VAATSWRPTAGRGLRPADDDEEERTLAVLLLDELGSDGPQVDVHRSSNEAGANYGLTGTCDSAVPGV